MKKSELKAKLDELKKIQSQIEKMKKLYQRKDELMEEILPEFIKKTDNQITINTEITIEKEKFCIVPAFFETDLKPKSWKSTCFENFSIK